MRFACTSDPAEYDELLRDPSLTDAWYTGRGGALDATSTDVFELVQLTVNGTPATIRRATRQGTQLYTASLGPHAETGEPITVAIPSGSSSNATATSCSSTCHDQPRACTSS